MEAAVLASLTSSDLFFCCKQLKSGARKESANFNIVLERFQMWF